MAKETIEFKRGDASSVTFKLPIADYVAGSSLFFTAKPEVDNDVTDANAVIDKEFTDADVDLDAVWAVYTCNFSASDINPGSYSDGESVKEFLGEFQYIAPGEDPVSFPPNNEYIKVLIYADIRRATS